MSDSLDAACAQFEQVMIGQMLRTAAFASPAETGDDSEDDSGGAGIGRQTAFDQLMTQALSAAIERAGGIGLRHRLATALRSTRS